MGEDQGREPARKEPLPDLRELHLRHRGLTEPVAHYYAEAAGVCLDRHHKPPSDFSIADTASVCVRAVTWPVPDDRVKDAWGNRDETTRDGAYALAIAAVEAERNLLAVTRAEVRSGADYYVAPAGSTLEDLETAIRLEVSGTDAGDELAIQRRLRQKVQQTRDGEADTPALACVVGFSTRRIAMKDLEDK